MCVYEKDRTVVRNVISEETSEAVCDILEQVVNGKAELVAMPMLPDTE